MLADLDEIGVCRDSNLIEVLQNVQERLGYCRTTLHEIARRTGIP